VGGEGKWVGARPRSGEKLDRCGLDVSEPKWNRLLALKGGISLGGESGGKKPRNRRRPDKNVRPIE